MKNNLLFVLFLSCALLSGCSKDDSANDDNKEYDYEYHEISRVKTNEYYEYEKYSACDTIVPSYYTNEGSGVRGYGLIAPSVFDYDTMIVYANKSRIPYLTNKKYTSDNMEDYNQLHVAGYSGDINKSESYSFRKMTHTNNHINCALCYRGIDEGIYFYYYSLTWYGMANWNYKIYYELVKRNYTKRIEEYSVEYKNDYGDSYTATETAEFDL